MKRSTVTTAVITKCDQEVKIIPHKKSGVFLINLKTFRFFFHSGGPPIGGRILGA